MIGGADHENTTSLSLLQLPQCSVEHLMELRQRDSFRGDEREGERWRGALVSDGEDSTVVEDYRS